MPLPLPWAWDGCSYKLMRSCWEEEPESRPTFKNLYDSLKVGQASANAREPENSPWPCRYHFPHRFCANIGRLRWRVCGRGISPNSQIPRTCEQTATSSASKAPIVAVDDNEGAAAMAAQYSLPQDAIVRVPALAKEEEGKTGTGKK
jgi:hypothetical protein